MSNTYSYFKESVSFGTPRITWAVQRLILITVAAYALQLVLQPAGLVLHWWGWFQTSNVVEYWAAFRPDAPLRGLIWTPVTYLFLHAGLLHLLSNMLGLYFFGPEIERLLGTRSFVFFYIICGAAATLANYVPWALTFLLTGGAPQPVFVVGASGAVMAVLMAYAVVEPEQQFFLFPFPIPVNARMLVAIVVVFNIISALGPGDSISVATHLGGLAAGFAYIRLLPQINRWKRNRRWKNGTGPQAPETRDSLGAAVDDIFKSNKNK